MKLLKFMLLMWLTYLPGSLTTFYGYSNLGSWLSYVGGIMFMFAFVTVFKDELLNLLSK